MQKNTKFAKSGGGVQKGSKGLQKRPKVANSCSTCRVVQFCRDMQDRERDVQGFCSLFWSSFWSPFWDPSKTEIVGQTPMHPPQKRGSLLGIKKGSKSIKMHFGHIMIWSYSRGGVGGFGHPPGS